MVHSVDYNQAFNFAYIICRFELHKHIKLMCIFNQNVALRYVMQNILIYQCLWWCQDPSPWTSWIL